MHALLIYQINGPMSSSCSAVIGDKPHQLNFFCFPQREFGKTSVAFFLTTMVWETVVAPLGWNINVSHLVLQGLAFCEDGNESESKRQTSEWCKLWFYISLGRSQQIFNQHHFTLWWLIKLLDVSNVEQEVVCLKVGEWKGLMCIKIL